ncbi:MAG: hypothetical protein J5U19_02750, partial [Candidatus Methanoperedens sp.]|nr:hypothetical protein [Candidatus Methanoperedens sp.]
MEVRKSCFLVMTFAVLIGLASAATVAVIPSNKIVSQGQTFDLNVSIDPGGTAIAGAQLNIEFNKTIFNVNSIKEGNLFKQNGASTFFNNGMINNSLGTVSNIFGAIIGHFNVSTPETFIIINFTALGSSGQSGINLSNVKISDPFANYVDLNVINGSVNINYTPLSPVNLASTQGNFWINHTWQAGAGIRTDSYNVSMNGTWFNGTTNNYFNNSVGAHKWSNITVYSYNNSGSVSTGSVSQDVQVANNAIIISGIQDSYSLTHGDMLKIDAGFSDADNDIGIFDRNFTKGTFDTTTGVLVWTTVIGDVGAYNWQINVSDSHGSVSTKNFTVTISLPISSGPTYTIGNSGNAWAGNSMMDNATENNPSGNVVIGDLYIKGSAMPQGLTVYATSG